MFSLALYRDGESDNRRPHRGAHTTGAEGHMKTTIITNTANPRRTTLAHLGSADELRAPERPEHAVELPTQTANPRRTILMVAPAQPEPATA